MNLCLYWNFCWRTTWPNISFNNSVKIFCFTFEFLILITKLLFYEYIIIKIFILIKIVKYVNLDHHYNRLFLKSFLQKKNTKNFQIDFYIFLLKNDRLVNIFSSYLLYSDGLNPMDMNCKRKFYSIYYQKRLQKNLRV